MYRTGNLTSCLAKEFVYSKLSVSYFHYIFTTTDGCPRVAAPCAHFAFSDGGRRADYNDILYHYHLSGHDYCNDER